jgi:hypothetical protein
MLCQVCRHFSPTTHVRPFARALPRALVRHATRDPQDLRPLVPRNLYRACGMARCPQSGLCANRCDSGCTVSRTPGGGSHCRLLSPLPLRTPVVDSSTDWNAWVTRFPGLVKRPVLAPRGLLLTARGANECWPILSDGLRWLGGCAHCAHVVRFGRECVGSAHPRSDREARVCAPSTMRARPFFCLGFTPGCLSRVL